MIHPNDEHRVHDLYSIGYNDREIARKLGYKKDEIRHWRGKNGLESNVKPNGKNVSYKTALPVDKHPPIERFMRLAAATKPGNISGLMRKIHYGHI